MKNKVAVFTTGGTISSVYSPDTGTIIPELSGAELITSVADYIGDVEVILHDLPIRPGPHITPDFVLKLSEQIKTSLWEHDVAGAVVVQGTDSVDETSYLLSLLIQSDKPVVVTGSMKSEHELYVDAIGNLAGAIRIAQSEKSKDKGVLVYFDETIHGAADVDKYHANRVDAFVSRNGALGGMFNGTIRYNRQPMREDVYSPKSLDEKVGLIKVCTGMDDVLVRACIDNGYKGIVIEGFGAGNVPPTLVDAIKEAIDKDIVVVIVTRCFNGEAIPVYDYKGGGAKLHEMGVVSGGNLSGQKARLKLLTLLGTGMPVETIRNIFE